MLDELFTSVDVDNGDVISDITGTEYSTLVSNIYKQPLDFQKRILSQEKFIEHEELNKQGLHLFRAVAAELAVIQRTVDNDVYHHPNYLEFNENGILILEDKYHWYEKQDQDLWNLLSMCAGKKVEPQPFRENRFVHQAGDIQNELHTDIFQPNVKSWMYLQDITLKHGPTNFIFGSHINRDNKLKYLYDMSTLPKGHPDIREGSFPLKDHKKYGFPDPTPVTGKKGTYFVCDTSGFHSRGVATPGTVRVTAKLHYRFNPFEN